MSTMEFDPTAPALSSEAREHLFRRIRETLWLIELSAETAREEDGPQAEGLRSSALEMIIRHVRSLREDLKLL